MGLRILPFIRESSLVTPPRNRSQLNGATTQLEIETDVTKYLSHNFCQMYGGSVDFLSGALFFFFSVNCTAARLTFSWGHFWTLLFGFLVLLLHLQWDLRGQSLDRKHLIPSNDTGGSTDCLVVSVTLRRVGYGSGFHPHKNA